MKMHDKLLDMSSQPQIELLKCRDWCLLSVQTLLTCESHDKTHVDEGHKSCFRSFMMPKAPEDIHPLSVVLLKTYVTAVTSHLEPQLIDRLLSIFYLVVS